MSSSSWTCKQHHGAECSDINVKEQEIYYLKHTRTTYVCSQSVIFVSSGTFHRISVSRLCRAPSRASLYRVGEMPLHLHLQAGHVYESSGAVLVSRGGPALSCVYQLQLVECSAGRRGTTCWFTVAIDRISPSNQPHLPTHIKAQFLHSVETRKNKMRKRAEVRDGSIHSGCCLLSH